MRSEGAPLPEGGTPYRIALVCLGNICRSPMAHVVLAHAVAEAGLDVEVTSAGTGSWHVGGPMDPRAAATLRSVGLDPSAHRASHYDHTWLDRDLVLAMDDANRRDLLALGTPPERLRMFRDFDPEGPGEVPDPYYGGDEGFERVLEMVTRTGQALAERLRARLG